MEFCNGRVAQNLGWCPYQQVEKFDNVFIRLDVVPQCDRQTEMVKSIASLHAMHANAR